TAAAALIGRDLVVGGGVAGGLDWPDWRTLIVLALLFLVCESAPTLLNIEQTAVSVSFSAALAAVVLVGPLGAALVGAVAVLSVRPGLPPVKRLFNGAQFAICGYAAGVVYRLAGGPDGLPVERFADLLVPYAAAAAVFVPLNILLIGVMLRLASVVRRDQVQLRDTARFLVSYLGYASFGLLIVGLWASVQS